MLHRDKIKKFAILFIAFSMLNLLMLSNTDGFNNPNTDDPSNIRDGVDASYLTLSLMSIFYHGDITAIRTWSRVAIMIQQMAFIYIFIDLWSNKEA